MAQIIRQGERLMNMVPRWDETHRFELILQPDGNLVVYAYILSNSEIERIAIGATHSDGAGPDVELDFTPSGALRLTNIISREVRWVSHPESIGGVEYPPAPNSSLHIQADGNCVVYSNWPNGVQWASGELDLSRLNNTCVSGSLAIKVLGKIDGGEKEFKNGRATPITVNDGSQNVVLFPGQSVRATASGYLGIPVNVGPVGGAGDAVTALKPGPHTVTI